MEVGHFPESQFFKSRSLSRFKITYFLEVGHFPETRGRTFSRVGHKHGHPVNNHPDNGAFCPWIQTFVYEFKSIFSGEEFEHEIELPVQSIDDSSSISYTRPEAQDIFLKTFLVSNFLRQFFSHGPNHTILIIVNNKLVYFRVRIICLVDT